MYVGKHVKLLLQGNLIIEGVVKDWFDDQVILTALDKKSLSIIMHPDEDIRVIKVMLDSEDVTPIATPEQPLEFKNDLEKKFEEVYNSSSDDSLRNKTLAELKAQLVEQEKIIVAAKLKDHNISETRKVKYEPPRFLKKPNI